MLFINNNEVLFDNFFIKHKMHKIKFKHFQISQCVFAADVSEADSAFSTD